jgi:hypothetical protein
MLDSFTHSLLTVVKQSTRIYCFSKRAGLVLSRQCLSSRWVVEGGAVDGDMEDFLSSEVRRA